MEEIYSILDRIMKLNHEVVDCYIKMADNEIMKKTQDKLLSKIVEDKMSMIRELYRKLREHVRREEEKQTQEGYDMFNILTMGTNQKIDNNVHLDIRELMENHIKESYLQMSFISDEETETYSIYEGTVEEKIRESEFESYRNNILTLENILDINGTSDITSLNYIQIASIIEDLSDNNMYKKSFNKISKVLEKLENDDYRFNSDGEKQIIRNKLIYMKYDELYKGTNQRMNSVVENFKYAPQIRVAQEDRYIHGLLGVTESDYVAIYQSRIYEYLDDVKQDVRSIFKNNRDISRRRNRVQLPNIGNVVSKLVDIQNAVKGSNRNKSKEEVR